MDVSVAIVSGSSLVLQCAIIYIAYSANLCAKSYTELYLIVTAHLCI